MVFLILTSFSIAESSGLSTGNSYGAIGPYGDLTCFRGDSSSYYGAEAGVNFSPFRYTDVGIGFSLMSGNEQTFTYVNGRIGLFSSAVWKLRALCGMSCSLQVTAPKMYETDCDWPGRDSATGGGISPYCGIGFLLSEGSSGSSLSVVSKVFFGDGTVRRISIGISLGNSIYND